MSSTFVFQRWCWNARFLFSFALLQLLGSLQDGGTCPIIPVLVSISSVTRSPQSWGTIPVKECGRQWDTDLVKSEHCNQMQLTLSHCLWCFRWPAGIDWNGRGLGEPSFCVSGFVPFPVMVSVRPQQSHLSTTVTGITCSMCLSLQEKCFCPSSSQNCW